MKIEITNRQKIKRVNLKTLSELLEKAAGLLSISSKTISLILVDNAFITNLNKRYLKKTTPTDVIAFDYSEQEKVVSGEIYISYQRIKDNAENYNQKIVNEIHRVVIHGVLHLVGYDDITKNQKEIMTQKEDYYLSLLSKIRFT